MSTGNRRRARGAIASRCVSESLEARRMLANLQPVAIFITNANGTELDVVPMGAFVQVHVDFTISGLPANASYRIQTVVNGEPIVGPVINWGAGGGDGPASYRFGMHFVNTSASTFTVSATIDVENTVAEANEADNTLTMSVPTTTFPTKLAMPIGGVQGVDWIVGNHYDTDQNTNTVHDYLGGPWTYNNHQGIDFSLVNFRKADIGVPIYAAAAGTIIAAHDGEFDRNTAMGSATANFVVIDHGNGWQTRYWHMRRNSVQVYVGQQVEKGQQLGLVGSSGSSTNAHLHFELNYNGVMVEPSVAKTFYWENPYYYTGHQHASLDADLVDVGLPLTFEELLERSPVQRHFAQSEVVGAWMHVTVLNPGEQVRFRYINPSNDIVRDWVYTAADLTRRIYLADGYALPIDAPVGAWRVEMEMAGQLAWSLPFTVSATGSSNVQLFQGLTQVIAGRKTPLNFGTTNQSSPTPVTKSFTILNRGQAPLTIDGLDLPRGFELASPLPTGIAPGDWSDIVIRLDPRKTDYRIGTAVLRTNDADQPETSFVLEGTVIDDAAPTLVEGTFDPDTNSLQLLFSEDVDFGYLYNSGVTVVRLSDNLRIPLEPTYPDADHRHKQRMNFFMHPTGLPDGNYRLTLPADSIGDMNGRFANAPVTVDFYVLAGDANRDRAVNFDDLLIVAQNYGQMDRTFSQGNFDYDPDGAVDFDDLLILAQRYGTQLVVAAAPIGKAAERNPSPARRRLIEDVV